MIKTFERCPNQARYSYAERLKPRRVSAREKPLRRGTWIHSLLEHYYKGNGWHKEHQRLSQEYAALSQEEQDELGDLPEECARLMRSYLWHYGADKSDPFHGWEILGAEETLECPWPDGKGVYRMRLDLRVRDTDTGAMYIVDHKSHKTLPNTTFRLLDKASALYLWCAQENGLPVEQFVWNYIRTIPPTKPEVLKDGTRLSRKAITTDYPTMLRAIQEYGLDWRDYAPQLKALKAQRWVRDGVQISEFFRRDSLTKDDAMLERVVASAMRTRDRLAEYVWDDHTERTVEPSCQWMCSHSDLCTTELFSGSDSPQARTLRQRTYRVGNPLDYYKEGKEVSE